MDRLIGVLRDGWLLTRGLTCVAAGGAAVLGAYLSAGPGAALGVRAALAAVVTGSVVGSSNVINDLRDTDADMVDKPHRPLPAGRISRRGAHGIAWALALVAVISAVPLGTSPLIQAFITLLTGWVYSYCLKNTVLVGNAVIALLDGYCVAFGAVCTEGVSTRIVLASISVALFFFAYLILLTVRDYTADLTARISTVATVLGERRAMQLFQLLAVVTGGAFLIPGIAGWFTEKYLLAVAVTVVAPTLAAAFLAVRRLPVAVLLLRLSWFPGLAALTLAR